MEIVEIVGYITSVISILAILYKSVFAYQDIEKLLMKSMLPKGTALRVYYGQMIAKLAIKLKHIFDLIGKDGTIDDVEQASFVILDNALSQVTKNLEVR